MGQIDWVELFTSVCNHGGDTLGWGLPEQWVQTELYSELQRREPATGWKPLSNEVPYVTFYPVKLTRSSHPDQSSCGAVKWVDLCLHSRVDNAWCWFELKVRHVGPDARRDKAAKEGLDVFRKDVVALAGFDAPLTAGVWEHPDKHTSSYWIEQKLKPLAGQVRSGKHHFAAAFLQLSDKLDEALWAEDTLKQQIGHWLLHRRKEARRGPNPPDMRFCRPQDLIAGKHALLLCGWPPNEE